MYDSEAAASKSTYVIRTTSVLGIAHYRDVRQRDAHTVACEMSRDYGTIEADIVCNGEFVAAYINGTLCQ